MDHIIGSFFGWPDGAVWGNIVADFLWLLIAALLSVLFRKRIEAVIARWRANHHAHIKEHITKEIAALERRLKEGSGDGQV